MIGVLVSGSGTNLQALIDDGLPIAAVASNVAGVRALERARQAKISSRVFPLDDYPDRSARDSAMADWLVAEGVRIVVCAGYMQLLTGSFLARFPGKVVNVHPSLLPAFPGTQAVADALAAGLPETGVTVHLVDAGVDTGPVLAQERVPIRPGDTEETLLERLHEVEHRLLPRATRNLLDEELDSRCVIRRALLSVYDKSGLEEFARGLSGLGVELLASGGTATRLDELGIQVVRVDELTDFPELLDGRVKTLHPRVHAGILARRDRDDDMASLAEHGIGPIDLVCVNLYPFEEVAWRKDTHEEDAVEMIDVGGPTMLRAAAKNFVHVVPVCSPSQYESVLAELREQGDLTRDRRRSLAAQAFAHTAGYEASIMSWFADRESFPEQLVVALDKRLDLAYGENPHQRAAYYVERGAHRDLLSKVEQLSGRELSFNSLGDLAAARGLLEEFELPGCVIVKHANPCGCAVASEIEDAYAKALASDPVSAYGGVVVLNRPVELELARRLSEQFVEVLLAPGFSAAALEILAAKPATRILLNEEQRLTGAGERDFRRVPGGFLVQDADVEVDDRHGMKVVTATQPDEETWGDALLAWRVVEHVVSNAIVIAKDLATIGVGSGQMSRVDAVRIAVEKAREHGHDLTGSALASDAFFPFPDGPRIALDAGVGTIVQPGGSKRDAEVIAAVEEAGAAMIFTGRRHFRH